MSQENIGAKAFVAGVDLEAYRRVKLSAGSGSQVEYAGVDEDFIGITASKVSSGEHVAVNLKSSGRTFKTVCSGVIAAGADIFGGADGKVAATGGASAEQGKALETSTADGDVIEVLFG